MFPKIVKKGKIPHNISGCFYDKKFCFEGKNVLAFNVFVNKNGSLRYNFPGKYRR